MSCFPMLYVSPGLSPLASLAVASAADAPPPITLTIEPHRFSSDAIHVKASTPVVLNSINKDAEDEEFEISALRVEKVIPGGKTLQVTIPALKPETYTSVGAFHEQTAPGRLVAQ